MFESYDYEDLIEEIEKLNKDDYIFIERKKEPLLSNYLPVVNWSKEPIFNEKAEVAHLLKELRKWNNPFGNFVDEDEEDE